MKLSHFSSEPISMDKLFNVEHQKSRDAIKPTGLWVSCDGEHDWESWVKSEQFNLGSYKFRQRITLMPDVTVRVHDPRASLTQTRVLLLTAPRDLDSFQSRFGMALIPDGRREWIDWPEVALHYDGLIIDPYIYARRMNMIWYYGWDCASGCLWRPLKTVASISEAEPVDWVNSVLSEEK